MKNEDIDKESKPILSVSEGKQPEESATTQKEVADEGPTLKEVILEQAREGEAPLSKNFTLKKILGGDILTTSTIRKQIWVVVLITFFIIIYISNRYSVQQHLIEIDQLQKELQDARYKALSTSSQLTENSRESNVLEMLKNNKDSVLKIANQPPYIITVPAE